jgi:hypothetical protein
MNVSFTIMVLIVAPFIEYNCGNQYENQKLVPKKQKLVTRSQTQRGLSLPAN